MLTDATIKAMKAQEKPYKKADREGLYLLVRPNGSKLWQQSYRFAGKQKVLSHGKYPTVSLGKARTRCTDAKILLSDGIDPGLVKQQSKANQAESAATTFKIVAESYLAFRTDLTEAYLDKSRRRLECHIYPALGQRPIADITAPDLRKAIDKVVDRGAIETAQRVLNLVGRVIRYAGTRGLVDTDITSMLRGVVPTVQARHHAAPTTPEQVGRLLRVIDGYRGSPVVCAAMKLAPMLFVRPGELRAMRWEQIDLEAGLWSYLVSKTKCDHIVPLSSQALAILEELPRTSDFVFPSPRTATRPISDNALIAALNNLAISKDDLTIHGWRATARTLLDEQLGERPDFIEAQLAHAVRDANGRAYNRTSFLAERTVMMQRWSDYLDQMKSPAVVQLARRRSGV
ncbi:MAG: integrase arm-type DNA-binding domain-containing protein [Gammaproteobacteria bacterium]|nr:integrase arm-type DNA-binding domain-containing protein [Gammaproteobacteria bacterium]